jgi:hypothetical protein
MAAHSLYLAKLTSQQRQDLERILWERQSHKCFLCDDDIDLQLHAGDLHVDHIVPIVARGADDPMNFALAHAACNEKKSATNLEIARLLFRFDALQNHARQTHGRGANLEDVLDTVGGGAQPLRIKATDDEVQFTFSDIGDPKIHRVPLYQDSKSGMRYFFACLPVQFLHHDDRINPRSIGGSLKGLMEEFYAGRPQLHVSLAWWAGGPNGVGPVKVFDGQHKAAAQILLGAKRLPVRVFVDPDLKTLLQANTNAGDTLKQVAFDMAVKRHLGSALFRERLVEYRQARGLGELDHSFSEQDLVSYFKGSRRETQKYVLDSVRNAITQDPDNRLIEYVEMAGKGSERPLSYSAIEKTFFSIFLYLKPLTTPLNHLDDVGQNPRHLEHTQTVRLMNLLADHLLQGRWDPEVASAKLEHAVQQGDPVPEKHLCAHRMTREEILHATLTYVSLIIRNFYAYTGQFLDEERLFQVQHPEALWGRLENFLTNLRGLPCWVDRNLSGMVFGAKQNRDFWLAIFQKGVAPNGKRVLTEPIDINKMIKPAGGGVAGTV